MTLTATAIFERVKQMDSDETTPFTLAAGTSESDVQAWYDGIDVAALETEANNQIGGTVVTDCEQRLDIGNGTYCINEIAESHNDDPDDVQSAYVIETGRTTVQYFKRGVGGKQPMTESEAQSELDDHLSELVDRAVNSELISRAQAEFGGS